MTRVTMSLGIGLMLGLGAGGIAWPRDSDSGSQQPTRAAHVEPAPAGVAAVKKRDRAWLSLKNSDNRQIVVGQGVLIREGTYRGTMNVRAVPTRGDYVLRVIYTSKDGQRVPFTFDAHVVPR